MAVIVNGDGILTGISSLATSLTDITSGRGTITGVTTVGTLQLGAGVSISSPRTQQAAIFTNNTEFFTVDDAGRVGVGTVTPNSDAHPENEKKINVGFITAKSIAGDIDARNVVVAGVGTFTDDVKFIGALSGRDLQWDKSDNTLEFLDYTAAKFGTDNDLTIYHNAGNNNSYITESGSGALIVGGSDLYLQDVDSGTGHYYVICATGGRVQLNYDNSERFRTTTSGGTLTGDLSVTNDLFLNDSGEAVFGTGGDYKIYHDGVNSLTFFDAQVGGVRFRTDIGNSARNNLILGAGVDLYHNNTIRLSTTTGGISIQNGNLALNRQDTGNEGGEIVFNRASDNANQWFNDVYGNDSTAKIRWHHGGAEKFAIKTNGDALITDGNLVLASGHGIDFSATAQAASPSSEILDDYEEGTWTFAIVPGGGSYQYNYGQTGYYRKIGNTVFINAWIHLIVSSTVSGGITLTGLPFTVQNRSRNWIPVGGYGQASVSSSSGLWMILTPNATTASFTYNNDTFSGSTNLTAGNLGNAAEMYINGSYFTDS